MDNKSKITINVSQFLNDPTPMARSQGKSLMCPWEGCDEVVLDFAGVREAYPAFCDEIFRVWQGSHPETKIVVQEANEYVWERIRTASKRAS